MSTTTSKPCAALPAGRQVRRAGFLALLVLCLLAYLPALNGPFLLDDQQNIEPTHMTELSWEQLLQAAQSNNSGMSGRPIAAMAFALNSLYADGYDSTFPYKLTNLFIHLLVACLIYSFTRNALGSSDNRPTSAAFALIVCALWTLHPLQVSTTMYVVQRMAQLAALFSIASMLCYCAARSSGVGQGWRCTAYCLAAIASAVFAVFSKENGALIPLYVLALEATVLANRQTTGPGRLTKRLAVGGSTVATLGLVIFLVTQIPHFADVYEGRSFGVVERLHAQMFALVRYVGWILVPDTTGMAFYHDSFSSPEVFGLKSALCATVLFGMLAYAVVFRLRRPTEAFGILLFFTAHILESTVVPLELVFEHRNYLASFGVLLTVSSMIFRVALFHADRPMQYTAVCCALALLTFLTFQRSAVWAQRGSIALEATLSNPRSERAWISLAAAERDRGNLTLAMSIYKNGLETLPGNAHIELQRLRTDREAGGANQALLASALRALRNDTLTEPVAALLERIAADLIDRLAREEQLASEIGLLFDAAWAAPTHQLSSAAEAVFTYRHNQLLLAEGRPHEALQAIRRTTELLDDNVEARLRLAETLLAASFPDQAVRVVDDIEEVSGRFTPEDARRARRVRAGRASIELQLMIPPRR